MIGDAHFHWQVSWQKTVNISTNVGPITSPLSTDTIGIPESE